MNLDALVIGDPDECWPWTGQRDRYGHGKARPGLSRDHMGVHRFVFELVYGAIPPGHAIDHLCETKHCQNPAHLEAVASGVNVVRSATTPAGANARKVACPKCGSDYEFEPRYDGGWRRFCRSCRNAYRREWAGNDARRAYAREWQRRDRLKRRLAAQS